MSVGFEKMKAIIRQYAASFSGLSAQVWSLGLMMFVNRLGSLILPFLALYTTQELGWTKGQAGISMGFYGFGGLLGALAGGWLVDRFGVFFVMFYSLLCSGFAYMSLLLFTDFYSLTAALFVTAFMADTLRPAVMTSVSLLSDDKTRTRGISLMRMAFNLAFAIGPALGGLLIAWADYFWIFIVDGMTCLFASMLLLYLLPVLKRYKGNGNRVPGAFGIVKILRQDRAFVFLLLSSVVMLISFFQLLFTLPLYLKEVWAFSEQAVGYFFAVNGFLVFVFEMPLVHAVERKWRLFPSLATGAVMIGVGLLCLSLPWASLAVLFLYLLLVSIGEIISFPFITSIAIRGATQEAMGKYMGLVSMMFSLAFLLAPVIGTQLVEHIGYNLSWVLLGFSGVISGVAYLYVKELYRKRIAVKN